MSAVQERYLSSLVVAHGNASACTQMDDYVRCLEYWHQNPTGAWTRDRRRLHSAT